MLKLNEEDFTNLITDFYTVFAPNYLEKVPNIIERYKNTDLDQRNAIQAAYIIYFQPKNPAYNQYKNVLPEQGTERSMVELMEYYSRGERIISKDLADKKQKELQENLEKLELKNKQEQEELIKNQKKLEDSKTQEQIKEIYSLKEQLEELKKQDNKKIEIYYLEMDYQILSFIETAGIDQNGKIVYKEYDHSNVIFPEKKFITSFSVGQRLILKNKDGNIIGIEIVNINDDYTGDQEKPVRLLELKRI